MSNGRDEFSKSIKDILAKRVGFLCSNPECKKPTIGSNEIHDKSTSIGEAAHITAASEGGPRYDPLLNPAERSSIDNGIWLCSNCASLIDKDPLKYSVLIIREWKRLSENESAIRLKGEISKHPEYKPFLEAELICHSISRSNRGYSHKNPLRTDREGNRYYDVSNRPIIIWLLAWRFDLVIYNNSLAPAYNVSIKCVGKIKFNHMDEIRKINNVPPLDKMVIKATYEEWFEGEYPDADKIIKPRIPDRFDDFVLELKYYDDQRSIHLTNMKVEDGELINTKIEE